VTPLFKTLTSPFHKAPDTGPPQYLIVGLGNPGGRYEKTRHNIGFMCVNRIAQRMGARFHSSKHRADVSRGSIAGVPVLLAQPQTFMNDSGEAVQRLAAYYHIEPDHIILIYDEIDLPFAKVRIREGGSAGGHRGVQSVIDRLRTSEIPRIRVGVGRGPGEAKNHVLSDFSPSQKQVLSELCDTVADIVERILSDGIIAAMNAYNNRDSMDRVMQHEA
jgi:peptidyl-tRNA hydrolase, PTH1 family